MLRKNFTKSFLLDLKPRDKSYVVYDEAIRTLLIRVDPSGGKSFCFRKKADRKVHFKTIGSFPELTIENARMHAAEAASTVARWKADEDRRELPLAKAARPDTFGNTIEAYIDQHIKTVHKNNPERLAKATKTTRWVLDKYLRHLKNKPLGDIDKKTLWKLHAELTVDNGFVTANRVLSFIRTIFYWAIDTENFTGENPAKRFRKRFNITKDEKSRKRHLQEDELKRLAAALLTEPNRDLQHFVVIALGTGARRGDIFRMRWEQLDWKNHEWKVPNQKTEEDYVVYLQPAVEAVLEMRRNKRVGVPFQRRDRSPRGPEAGMEAAGQTRRPEGLQGARPAADFRDGSTGRRGAVGGDRQAFGAHHPGDGPEGVRTGEAESRACRLGTRDEEAAALSTIWSI